MGIRSFLAFELTEDIREIIFRVVLEIKRFPLDIRWVKVENIHLTVVFMGNIKEEDIIPISKVSERVCRNYAPFRIALTGADIFGKRHNPRVLWLGLNGDTERMSYFRDDLQKALIPFGIKEEKRPFKPHLTLGRFPTGRGRNNNLADILERYKKITSPVSMLKELSLFRSDLKRTGAVYTKLHAWPLIGQ
jgi:2'-5' RNA ligase